MSQLSLQTGANKLQGTIAVPGDKSISHRAIMFGSLAEGRTVVEHFLEGEDCLSTISCFRKLGVDIQREGSRVIINGKGIDALREPGQVLDVGNSGTTIRLISGILAALPIHTILVGDESIGKRPMNRVVDPLREMGAAIDGREHGKFTPLSVRGGSLKGITYEMPIASAQVKSAILLAGLNAEGTTTVIEKEPTRNHTETMLRMFGVKVRTEGKKVSVEGGQKLKGTSIEVPGDISSAAFFMVAAAIAKDAELVLERVGLNETRAGIIDVMKAMGADLHIEQESSEEGAEPMGTITVKHSKLKATEIKGSMIPRLIDEIPIIALMATQADGKTVIADAKELKVKETNRIDTVVAELQKMGADIRATVDGMIINGPTPLKGAEVDSHGDHRIGMMLAIAALIANGDATLANANSVAVSYPSFFEDLKSVIRQ
ncbi:3-phosphoshikimate 1-carboxyvinyltransferase [Bacillus testis]|uniref:3-phosphoshikimate 1-carboxyvinyltransferase n=1 Tax=Bacillus testis TaxID=1622072 RepID=UPI00067F01BA|nr:3-phosphoshikimate 1-carboxyvinyltransferase [Bacillus testis]